MVSVMRLRASEAGSVRSVCFLLIGKPVIRSSVAQPMKGTSALADDANEKRKDLTRLYPGAKQIGVERSHGILLDNLQPVILATREVQPPTLTKRARHASWRTARRFTSCKG